MKSLLLITVLVYAVVDANAECTRNPLSSLDYEYVKDLSGVNQIVFQVKTCRDALIALAPDTEIGHNGNTGVPTNAYEVAIGGWDNTKTVIREFPGQGAHVAEYNGNNIVDCNNFKSFWIKWDSTTLYVGKGSTVGSGEMVRSDRIMDIKHMYITGHVVSTWKFVSCDTLETCNPSLTLENTESWAYTADILNVTNTNHIYFQVKTCHDAILALCTTNELDEWERPIKTDCHEVVIGGWSNTKSVIRNNIGDGDHVTELDNPDGFTDCDNFLDFWVGWDPNWLAAGYGKSVWGDLIVYAPLHPKINYVHIRGNGAPGEWIFNECELQAQ